MELTSVGQRFRLRGQWSTHWNPCREWENHRIERIEICGRSTPGNFLFYSIIDFFMVLV